MQLKTTFIFDPHPSNVHIALAFDSKRFLDLAWLNGDQRKLVLAAVRTRRPHSLYTTALNDMLSCEAQYDLGDISVHTLYSMHNLSYDVGFTSMKDWGLGGCATYPNGASQNIGALVKAVTN